MSLVTLLAVVDMPWGSTSSAGETRSARAAVPEFLPKLSFHLEGFLGIGFDGSGGGAIVDGRVLVRRAGGIA